jgi:DNA repair protein RadC
MYDREVFACLFLNAKNQLISFDKMFFGSTNQASIFVSEIAKKAKKMSNTESRTPPKTQHRKLKR